MTPPTTQAEALLAAASIYEGVLEAFQEADRINDLDALMLDAQAGASVVTHYRAKRLGERDEKLDRATSAFAGTATRLLRDYRRDRLTPDELRLEMRKAFIHHARYSFRAGKRELGNTDRLTLEDEREIAEVVDSEGLTRGQPIPPGSIGGLVERVVNEDLTPDQERLVASVQRTIDDHVGRGVGRAVDAAAARSPDRAERVRSLTPELVDVAKGRVEKQVANLHRRVLSGSLVADAAAILLFALIGREILRSYRRARSAAGNGRGPLTVAEQAELDTLQRFAEQETLAIIEPAGLNWGRLLILAMLARTALSNSNIDHWLRDRLGRVAGQFYRLAMGGEKAALRDGVTAPKADDAILPGAGTAAPDPSPLQKRTIVWWVLGVAEHCIDCVHISSMSPYYLDVLVRNGMHPASGHTRCRNNCRCTLEFDLPQFAMVNIAV